MRFNVNMLGLSKTVNKAGKIPRRLHKGIDRAIKKSAFLLERNAKQALTVGPTRAIRTGRLRADTQVRELAPMRATIYPTVFYAIYVHEGTRYMRSRPFMKVAVDASKPAIKKIFQKEVGVAVSIT